MPSYKLLAADGKEYGPVSVDQVRTWIAQGRANTRSKLQAAVPTLEAAGRVSGVRPGPPVQGPGLPAGIAGRTDAGWCGDRQDQWPGRGCTGAGLPRYRDLRRHFLVGLVLGIIALVRINKSHGQLKGQGLALAGLIVSIIFLLLLPIFAAMLLPALAQAKAKAQSIQCIGNVKQLNLALMMYASDNNEQLPDGAKWCDALKPYLGIPTSLFVPKAPRASAAITRSMHNSPPAKQKSFSLLRRQC